MQFMDPEYISTGIMRVLSPHGIAKPTQLGVCYAMALKESLDVVNNNKPGNLADYDCVEPWHIPEGTGLHWFFKYIESHVVNRYILIKAIELDNSSEICAVYVRGGNCPVH